MTTTERASSGYRADVQGLRALAVLAVVAFHAHLPVPGGFAGVDIFFVISGFVITRKLLKDHARYGRISLPAFWRRRFLRLTPALALLVSIVLLAGGLILFPDQQERSVATGIGAMLLVANIVIARTTGGYFDGPAEGNPLLNTWSLSVEEQFYLVFPLVVIGALWMVRRSSRSRPALITALGIIFITSFGLAVYGSLREPGAIQASWLNFYSPVGRAWEFTAGALVALAPARRSMGAPRFWSLTSWLALLAILATALLLDSSVAWPGPWTLVPVLATAWVIYAGSMWPRGSVQRLLGSPPGVKVGDWSYSIYLWHWPFISFALYLGVDGAPGLTAAAFVSLIPAIASYYWVETPLRSLRVTSPKQLIPLVVTVVGIPLAIAVLVTPILRPTSVHPGDIGARYLSYIDKHSYPCAGALADGSADRCRQSQADGPIDTIILGDSHAEHLYPGLLDALPDTNIAYAYMANWPGWPDERSASVFDAVASDPSIKNVIINGRWSYDLYGEAEVAERVRQMAAAGKQVFLGNDGPYFSFHSRECKYARPLIFPNRCTEPSGQAASLLSLNDTRLRTMVDGMPSAGILDTAGVWCVDGTCSMLNGDELLFADQGHLNVLGSRFLANQLLATDERLSTALGVKQSPLDPTRHDVAD